MSTSPALSVILPVRNAITTVESAIQSVLKSTFQDFELVIVDDGSTDGSDQRIRSFDDDRIRFFRNPTPDFCTALNLAVENCQAPLIARMDADDRNYPQRFTVQLEAMQQNGWDIVGGLVRIVDRKNRPVPSYARYERWINSHRDNESIRAHRFVESPLANPSTLAKREVYSEPFRDGPFPEDYNFWLHAIHRGFSCGKVDQVVIDWIDSPSRTTRNHSRYSPAAFDRCRRSVPSHAPRDRPLGGTSIRGPLGRRTNRKTVATLASRRGVFSSLGR